MPPFDEIRRELRERLSPPRADHVLRVVDTAVRLAGLHGCDRAQAETAALLHDWYREVPDAEIVALARDCGALGPEERPDQVVPTALHGPVAARLLPRRWPELPAAVCAAIDRHTTGAPDMTLLDCLLYVADMVEPGHTYNGVEALRAAAEVDLRQAALAGMTATMQRLLQRGRAIDLRTVAARNALLASLGGAASASWRTRADAAGKADLSV